MPSADFGNDLSFFHVVHKLGDCIFALIMLHVKVPCLKFTQIICKVVTRCFFYNRIYTKCDPRDLKVYSLSVIVPKLDVIFLAHIYV